MTSRAQLRGGWIIRGGLATRAGTHRPWRVGNPPQVSNPAHMARLILLFSLLARFAPAQMQACQPIAADQVLGKDLAAAIPAFANLPSDALLAQVPPPGSKRIFHSAELLSIARRYSIALDDPQDICFEWRVEPLDRARVADAMRQSLALPEARLEIADMLLSPVPSGKLDFPRERLGTPAGRDSRSPVLWRGDVIYGDGHRFPVWARVRISVPCKRVAAAENLRAGQPITASQLRETAAECFPSAAENLSIERIAGSALRHPVTAGTEIVADLLTGQKEVNRGDSVEIEVFSGAARLQFTAKAESDGNSGEMISVRNPSSNRVFRARVNGKDKAVVQAGDSAPDLKD